MAGNSRNAKREALSQREKIKNEYLERLEMLYDNAVKLPKIPADLPKRYLLQILRENGGIAYDKPTKLFLRFIGKEIDIYGLPKKYELYGYNGFIVERSPEEVVILRTSDNQYIIQDYFEMQAEKLADYDMAIAQNLEAVKTMTIVEVGDDATLLSLANEQSAKRIGATVVYRNKKAMVGNETKATNTGAQYLVDKLLQARKEIFNETLSAVGINVANVDKKERVQNNEIRASQGYGIDSIRTLIETFNYDAKFGGIDNIIEMQGNTSLYEQYILDIEKQKFDMKGENSNETNG